MPAVVALQHRDEQRERPRQRAAARVAPQAATAAPTPVAAAPVSPPLRVAHVTTARAGNLPANGVHPGAPRPAPHPAPAEVLPAAPPALQPLIAPVPPPAYGPPLSITPAEPAVNIALAVVTATAACLVLAAARVVRRSR
ncbi:MAG: hypothetical protein JOY68_11445 [Candidatus Dormibacteraeota bacterium]|nr:hypothetical protein [Candidatus Dormibacteraeota bacterium]MBV8446156.1 hypothetical protein [Candidatus Dormibacteraeota bacterium]